MQTRWTASDDTSTRTTEARVRCGRALTSARDPRPQQERYLPFPDVARRNVTQELLEVPALVHSLSIPTGARILELGCGRGVALVPLARLCEPRCLTGVDIDSGLLLDAQRRLEERGVEAELVCADARELPFADRSFDVVIDFGTCYHIDHPESALREVARVLVDGGMFVYETRISQLLAHPVRSATRRLPGLDAPKFRVNRTALLWSSRITAGGSNSSQRLCGRHRSQPQP